MVGPTTHKGHSLRVSISIKKGEDASMGSAPKCLDTKTKVTPKVYIKTFEAT